MEKEKGRNPKVSKPFMLNNYNNHNHNPPGPGLGPGLSHKPFKFKTNGVSNRNRNQKENLPGVIAAEGFRSRIQTNQIQNLSQSRINTQVSRNDPRMVVPPKVTVPAPKGKPKPRPVPVANLAGQSQSQSAPPMTKWYCCPFCRDILQQKNLRVFANPVGLIVHVKRFHPEKQQPGQKEIEVLLLQQSSTIPNQVNKTCFTKSFTKLMLSTGNPSTTSSINSASASTSTRTWKSNPVLLGLSAATIPMPGPPSTSTGITRPTTLVSKNVKSRARQPKNTKKLSKERLMEIGQPKPRVPLSLVSQNKIKVEKVAKIPTPRPIMMKPINTPKSQTVEIKNAEFAGYLKKCHKEKDEDVIVEKIVAKPKPRSKAINLDGKIKHSVPDVIDCDDSDSDSSSDDEVKVFSEVRPKIELIDLTTESESMSDVDVDMLDLEKTAPMPKLSNDHRRSRNKYPRKTSLSETELQLQVQAQTLSFRSAPAPVHASLKAYAKHLVINNDNLHKIKISTSPQQLPSSSRSTTVGSFVHAQVQVPDYSEEIEFEMGEIQSDNTSDDNDENSIDEPMDASSPCPSSCCSTNSNWDDLECNPLDLDEFSLDLLYSQMHQMFPRLYDLDQLMTSELNE